MLYGLVILLDKKKYEKVIRDISGVAANVNPIAVRVNSTDNYSLMIFQNSKRM